MRTHTGTNRNTPLYTKISAVLLCGMLLFVSMPLQTDALTTDASANAATLIAAGAFQSMALKTDGTVKAWGYNYSGQSTILSGLTDVTAVAGGFYYSLALKADGTVVAWGYNDYGQCDVPSGLTDAAAIAAGAYHTLALKSDDTVVAWGDNDYGQCDVPSGLAGVTAIAAGGFHSLALKSDGTVVAWGDNDYGQCDVPSGLTGVVAIAAGRHHSLALKSDGTVVAWGYNADGQCNVPSGLTSVVAIVAGFYHSLALKSDGTVVAWGDNDYGQRDVPSGLTDVVAIAAGAYHTLALKSDGSVVAWGYNSTHQCNVPSGLDLAFSLNDLFIDGGDCSPSFDPAVYAYTIDVPNAVDSISLTPMADSNVGIMVQGVSKASGSTTTVPLYIGGNTITVSAVRKEASAVLHTYTFTVTRALPDSTNAALEKLETSTGVLSPVFDTDTTAYTVSVAYGITSMDITALPEDSNASVSIAGQGGGTGEQTVSVSLNEGDNVIPVEIRAGDSVTVKTYTVTVVRGLSDNADLSALSIGTGSLSPAFDADTVAYSIQTTEELESIAVTATTVETDAVMTIGGQTATSNTPVTVPLDNGANLIPIVITAPDGTTQRSYILSVNGTVSDADLSSLSLSAGTLSFDADTTAYYVSVGSDVTSIDLTASASDSKAVILLNGGILSQGGTESLPLAVGENTAELMVIAQDATAKTYTITINRGSSDATLDSLSLSAGTLSPAFARTVYTYTATVSNTVTSLTVTPVTADSESTVTVNGHAATEPVSLAVGGNAVTVQVTGSDGVTQKTYTLTVTRRAEITVLNASLPVGIVDGAYHTAMTAEGGDGTFSWSALNLPASLSLDSSTGILSGTPIDGEEGTYNVTITVTDGQALTGTADYTLVVRKGCAGGAYRIVSDGDAAYTGSYTDDGIPTLTVNDGVSGFTYFSVTISAVTGHTGEETCLFVHTRNNTQLCVTASKDDFDSGGTYSVSFNVQAGDVIEVYIVDALTNGASSNPDVL